MPERPGANCRQCLLREMTDRANARLAEDLEAWIASIPLQQRAEPAETERRLVLCRRCPHLDRGTCQLCGCYVEYRASFTLQDCPDLPSRWALPGESSDSQH